MRSLSLLLASWILFASGSVHAGLFRRAPKENLTPQQADRRLLDRVRSGAAMGKGRALDVMGEMKTRSGRIELARRLADQGDTKAFFGALEGLSTQRRSYDQRADAAKYAQKRLLDGHFSILQTVSKAEYDRRKPLSDQRIHALNAEFDSNQLRENRVHDSLLGRYGHAKKASSELWSDLGERARTPEGRARFYKLAEKAAAKGR